LKRLLKNSHVVILRSLGRRRISNDSFEILRGVHPESRVEILRFAQNDRRRRAQNDKEPKLAANGKFQQLVEGLIKQ